ncbi:TetR/AcrR family transcriptional regulator [Ferrimonas balearica]|uniref:TetR/AcrR family transcriptional regulator n=1 Tax=Ferrimonas balearica TaxID=44012 RepID=UPI001C99A371|nr:TetR/AcrR family transcriptional regulator [Ferrimonas balearica]MBY5923269.1 TetR/AcrR family transcriptional regulator [Ferrimonas balearica]MBY5995227.1 TetR/AcrR family transcriptional regulator [Ferrimonas balearica]
MQCPSSAAQYDRCQLILNATEWLIETQGLIAFKISDLSNHAGIANSSLYKLFESKEDLLVCCFLRNATSNHFASFEAQYPDMTPMQRVLVPIMFTFEATHFAPTFNLVRQVAVNPMVWRRASPEKVKAFESRINLFWRAIKGYVQEAVESGDLVATDEEVLELTQAITFYLSGALSAYQSQLIDSHYLKEKRFTLFRQLQKVLLPYQWREPLALADFERIGMRAHLYYRQLGENFNRCERCQQAGRCGQPPSLAAK